MGAKRSIRSYIGPGGAALAVLAAALLLTLLCALTGPRTQTGRAGAPKAFDELEAGGDESAYLDVVGISEAICTFGPDRFYYVAEVGDLSFRLVCLNTEEYGALTAQRDYWNSLADMPEPYRLVGRKYPVSEDVKQSFLTVFNMDGENFDANFGTACLITQPAPEPVRGIGHPLLTVLFALLFLLAAGGTVWQELTVQSALTRLMRRHDVDAAGKELLDEQTQLLCGDRLRLGRRFLFGWRCGLAAAWEDVLWCYGRAFPFGRLLTVCTADGKRHGVFFRRGEEKALRELTAAITAHSDSVLMGMSAANRDAYARACR